MKKIRFSAGPAKTICAVLGMAVLAWLGTWQTQRLEVKTELLARISEKIASDPQIFSLDIAQPEEFEYRPFILNGTFAHDKERHLLARTKNGKVGVEIITPLITSSDRVLIVNRGFAENDKIDQFARPDGMQRMTAYMSLPVEKGFFQPDNDPHSGSWFTINPAQLEQDWGMVKVQPFIFSIDPIDPDAIPNNHKSYAITWFCLAIALGVIYLLSSTKVVSRPT